MFNNGVIFSIPMIYKNLVIISFNFKTHKIISASSDMSPGETVRMIYSYVLF